jgi:hypothetical protein
METEMHRPRTRVAPAPNPVLLFGGTFLLGAIAFALAGIIAAL